MTTQIKQVIAKVTGREDFDKHLSLITGQIQTIDKAFYIEAVKKIQTFYKSFIAPEVKKLSESELQNLERLYKKLNLDALYVDKRKKNGKIVQKLRLRPKDIYDSEWFVRLREIEKSGSKFCKQFNVTKQGITEDVKTIINSNLTGARLFKFLGRSIVEDCGYSGQGELKVVFGAFAIREFCKKITEIILTPMYDVDRYMITHWNPKISEVLNTQVAHELKAADKPHISDEDVRRILFDYVLFSYRLEITGSPAELTKILKKNMKMTQLDNISASELATIVEQFNLTSVGDSAKKMQEIAIEALKELDNTSSEDDITKTFSGTLNKIYNTFMEPKKGEEAESSETHANSELPELPEDVFA